MDWTKRLRWSQELVSNRSGSVGRSIVSAGLRWLGRGASGSGSPVPERGCRRLGVWGISDSKIQGIQGAWFFVESSPCLLMVTV